MISGQPKSFLPRPLRIFITFRVWELKQKSFMINDVLLPCQSMMFSSPLSVTGFPFLFWVSNLLCNCWQLKKTPGRSRKPTDLLGWMIGIRTNIQSRWQAHKGAQRKRESTGLQAWHQPHFQEAWKSDCRQHHHQQPRLVSSPPPSSPLFFFFFPCCSNSSIRNRERASSRLFYWVLSSASPLGHSIGDRDAPSWIWVWRKQVGQTTPTHWTRRLPFTFPPLLRWRWGLERERESMSWCSSTHALAREGRGAQNSRQESF